MKYYLLFILFLAPAPLFCMNDDTDLTAIQAEEGGEDNSALFERSCEWIEYLGRFDFCEKKMEEVVSFIQDGWKNGTLYEKLGTWHEEQEKRGHYPITYSFAVASVLLVGELKCPGVLIPPAICAVLGARKFIEVWHERKLNGLRSSDKKVLSGG